MEYSEFKSINMTSRNKSKSLILFGRKMLQIIKGDEKISKLCLQKHSKAFDRISSNRIQKQNTIQLIS